MTEMLLLLFFIKICHSLEKGPAILVSNDHTIKKCKKKIRGRRGMTKNN
jgi:hypothetical protein